MATFLDVGLFGYFGAIFPVLLVFLLVFAVLTKSKPFGENKGIYALISFSLAMMMLFMPGVLEVINIMAPWFVLLFMFGIMFIVVLLVLGVDAGKISSYMSADFDTPHWFVLAIAIVIVIGALSSVYGGSLLPFSDGDTQDTSGEVSAQGGTVGTGTSTGDFNQNVARVIFHPKVIGMVFVLLVASFTIRFMAGSK